MGAIHYGLIVEISGLECSWIEICRLAAIRVMHDAAVNV